MTGRRVITAYAVLGLALVALLVAGTIQSARPWQLGRTSPEDLAAGEASAAPEPLPMEEWVRTGSCWSEEVVSAGDPDLPDSRRAASPAEAVSELVENAQQEVARNAAAVRAATADRRALRLRADVSRERAAVLRDLVADETLAAVAGVAWTSVWTVEDDAGEVIAYVQLYRQPGAGWHVASSAVRLSEPLCAVLRGTDAGG